MLPAGYGSRIPGSRGTGSSAAYASSPDAIMRRGFLRKVLGLVTAQLLATALVAGSLGLSAGGKAMLVANPWLLTLSMVASIAIMLVVRSAARSAECVMTWGPRGGRLWLVGKCFERICRTTCSSCFARESLDIAFRAATCACCILMKSLVAWLENCTRPADARCTPRYCWSLHSIAKPPSIPPPRSWPSPTARAATTPPTSSFWARSRWQSRW